MSDKPETYTLDLPGDNGTPFRFIFWPWTGEVRYYDRRYPTQPGELFYDLRRHNENGQQCGGDLRVTDFVNATTGMRGWHENDAWDVDRAVMVMVGDWLETIKERDVR